LAAAALVLGAVAPAGAAEAPLLEGMGSYRHPTGSRSELAQRYFDQGMVLAWGFNPAEAVRSFEAATRLDPACAVCFWGLAWALGPNLNSDMEPGAAPRVAAALSRARALAAQASPADRALIAALGARHPAAAKGVPDEEGYAARMRDAARRHPRDADVATLAAEAIMNAHPYDWWERDGKPQRWTPEIVALLERALALAPDHPGAHHYWVHLMESSADPARGLASAQRLETLVPGSGHLLHMPAHIYMRTGRYADASAANERSIAADARYVAQVQAQGAYLVGYAAHNQHFLWASAAMEGRSAAAIAAARAAYRTACGPGREDRSTGILQHYYALPLYALVRFGRWTEILRDTLPPEVSEPYPTAVWHFARGAALARTGDAAGARRELAALERVAADPALARVKVKNINTTAALARIAVLTLRAEIALAERRFAAAVADLEQATAVEDGLEYDEPHVWLAPTRHALGAALIAAGRPADAERVYREDLAHYPENGWSLQGLARALAAQGRREEARTVEARYRAAWRRADFDLAKF
jgi:tetratricopeptide (TPR) repeat protein